MLLGGLIPHPRPRRAIRLTRESLVYRSGCPLGSGRRRRRGGRLPGQLCPTQIWCVSLQCRSAFAGQLEAGSLWTPAPGPVSPHSLAAQNKLTGPKIMKRSSGQKESSLSILLTNDGEISSLAKALSVLGLGQGAGWNSAGQAKRSCWLFSLPTGTFPQHPLLPLPDSDRAVDG